MKGEFLIFILNMYTQVKDQQHYDVPYQHLQINKPNVFNPQQTDSGSSAIAHFNIPNEVGFRHVFEACCCSCSGNCCKEQSSFDIQGIGHLHLSYTFCGDCCSGPSCCHCDCNYHDYSLPEYTVQNDSIKMEFWNERMGKIKANGVSILEFQQALPNCCDVTCAHFQSGYPQIRIKKPFDPSENVIILSHDPNSCPETCFSLGNILAIFGLATNKRNFQVEGLTQGKCTIVNTRNCMEALAKITGTQGKCTSCCCCCCCCPDVDYPNFNVTFENVLQIDKIAILMGLVHYSIYKKWFILSSMAMVHKPTPVV